MTEVQSPPVSRDAPTIVSLVGDLDLSSHAAVRERLAAVLELRRPLVVDLGDCTFIDGEIVQMLVEACRLAKDRSLGFVVVLPFSASALVRRVLLEVLPDQASFPIAPTVRAATAALAKLSGEGRHESEQQRLQRLRASLWENAAQLEELRTRRDALLLEQRRMLESVRRRRT